MMNRSLTWPWPPRVAVATAFLIGLFVCSFRNSFFLVMNIGASGYCSDFFSPVMLHTEKNE